MKEEEFTKKYPKECIEVPIYFSLDDEENVIIDEEEMRDYFDNSLEDILEKTRIEEDELKSIVKEKIEKIRRK